MATALREKAYPMRAAESAARGKLLVGLLGDPHGDFKTIDRIMAAEPDVLFWVCTGDLAGPNNEYFSPTSRMLFTPGNHENWDTVDAMRRGATRVSNLVPVFSHKAHTVDGIVVVGFCRNYAPNFFDRERRDLPYPKEGAARPDDKRDHRRHFVRGDLDAALALSKKCPRPHLLVTHEAPRCYYDARPDLADNGVGGIIQSLTRAFRPAFHLFGHHHWHWEYELAETGTRIIGMPYPKKEYLLIDFSASPPAATWKEPPASFRGGGQRMP